MKKIIILDGYSMLGRAYYSLPLCESNNGHRIDAIAGLIYVIRQELLQEDTEVYAVLGNRDRGLFHELYEAPYLVQKQYSDGLLEQTMYLQQLIDIWKIPCVCSEEDSRDIIFSLIQSHAEETDIRILTGDKRMLDLVSEQVEVSIPQVIEQKLQWRVFDKNAMRTMFGIEPERWRLACALMGMGSLQEKTDIGQANALEMAMSYSSATELYDHIEELQSKRLRRILTEIHDKVFEWEKALKPKFISVPALEGLSEYKQHFEDAVTELYEALGIDRQDAMTLTSAAETKKVTWSYRVEKVKNINQAETIWKSCMEGGVTGLQVFAVKAGEDTQVLASASGQLCLSFGEDTKEDILAVAVINKQYTDTVFWMSSQEGMSLDYLRDKLDTYMMQGKDTFVTFDVKNQYGYLLSRERKAFSLKEAKRIFDVKIAAYLLNPLKSDYQIQDIASEYLGLEMPKWQDLFGKADIKSAFLEKRDQFVDYYAKIAWTAAKTAELLKKKLSAAGMDELMKEVEMPLSYVLFDMEQEGIQIKPEALKRYGEQLQVRITELEGIIYQEAGEEFNINSPKQLGEILFEKLGLPGGKKTKTGYSTAADVLEKLSEEYPIVDDILEYRQLTKLKSTYADGLANYIDQDNRIHTNFNQTITATGRLSSTEPNLQNIPMRMELGRLIRKVFVPKAGCVFVDADYSQIELRVLAHMSGDEKLIEAYKMSEDIHKITASQVFHTPFDEVSDLQRRNAKAVNFGIVYGISSFGLSQGLSITRKEAAEYIERYFETYPGVKAFLDRLVSEAKLSGQSVSMFHRIRPIPELQSSNYMQRQFGERVAMNAPIQGTAADIIKIAMVRVWEALHDAGLRSKLILQIHDELLIETVEEETEQVQKLMAEKMQEAADLAVALEIDMHVGTDWYEAK